MTWGKYESIKLMLKLCSLQYVTHDLGCMYACLSCM